MAYELCRIDEGWRQSDMLPGGHYPASCARCWRSLKTARRAMTRRCLLAAIGAAGVAYGCGDVCMGAAALNIFVAARHLIASWKAITWRQLAFWRRSGIGRMDGVLILFFVKRHRGGGVTVRGVSGGENRAMALR